MRQWRLMNRASGAGEYVGSFAGFLEATQARNPTKLPIAPPRLATATRMGADSVECLATWGKRLLSNWMIRPRSPMIRGRPCGRSMLAACFTPPLAVRHVTQMVAYDLHFLAYARPAGQMPIESYD